MIIIRFFSKSPIIGSINWFSFEPGLAKPKERGNSEAEFSRPVRGGRIVCRLKYYPRIRGPESGPPIGSQNQHHLRDMSRCGASLTRCLPCFGHQVSDVALAFGHSPWVKFDKNSPLWFIGGHVDLIVEKKLGLSPGKQNVCKVLNLAQVFTLVI